ncbi:MAG: FAD-dependent oxidoreductase [Desulfobacteraceae bacterium]|nr:FAD-dependent oxidoreductase [Desulfobacteraceae bacterium]
MSKQYDFSRALAEADRCLLCHDAPCSKGCPANTDPGKFIKKFKMQNIKGAIRTIKENNILGGACGVLCPTARLCEKECSASHLDRPIKIGKIQEFLVRHGREINFKVFEKPEVTGKKVAIIGSGPAGISCGAALARKGYQVTIFEKMEEPGGVLRYGVPSYRFGKDSLKKELKDVTDLGVEFKCSHPIQEKGEVQDLLSKGFQAVFIATGLWDAADLFDKKPAGVYNSVDFLSSPHTIQSDLIKDQVAGKKVAVIGGGSVAMDCAGFAQTLGAQDVYLIYRRSFNQMPAEPDEKIESLENNIHFLILNQPKDYITDDTGKITGIKLARTQLAKAKKDQRRVPVEVKDSQWSLDIDIVVEAIGNKAFEDSGKIYPGVDLDAKKLIKASLEDCRTSQEGIFAGGDIVRGPSLVVNAVQDGKTAANTIDSYLKQRKA